MRDSHASLKAVVTSSNVGISLASQSSRSGTAVRVMPSKGSTYSLSGAEGVQGAECVHCLVVAHADFVGVVEYVVKQAVEVGAVELVSSAGVLECLDCFYSVGGEVDIIFHIGNFLL